MKKRILHVLRPVEGGIKEHVKLLSEKLCPYYQVIIACPSGTNLAKVLEKRGIQFISFELIGDISPWSDFKNVLNLAKTLEKNKVDLLHLHGYKAGFVGRLASLLCRDIPVVLTLHNYRDYQQKSILPSFCFTSVEKILSRKTDIIITVSQALRKDLLNNLAIEERKVVNIYNGINYSDYGNAQERLLKSEILVGTAARLAPQKGIEDFLEAAKLVLQQKKNKRIKFFIAGEGPLREKLEKQAVKLGLKENVFFLGHVEDMPGYLSSLDIFVLPSRHEGLSITLLEALAARRPVVATKTGGIPEIVVHGVTGYLVPPAQPLPLAEGIERLNKDFKLRSSLALKGQKMVKENFGLEIMVERTRALYEKLLAGI